MGSEAVLGNEIYECGSILHHLLKREIIEHQNVWIMGTQDPDRFQKNGQPDLPKNGFSWIEEGRNILSNNDLLSSGIPDDIRGKTYISFDLDLGSMSCVFAARFLDYVGLDLSQIFNIIHTLKDRITAEELKEAWSVIKPL